MDAIRQQCSQMHEAWQTAYKALAPNPTAYQSHLVGASLEQINEAVETVVAWADRSRAPKRLAPAFHLARALAATSLSAAIPAAQALSRGELAHFPAFIAAITQCLAALHVALLFGEPEAGRELSAELAAKLAEGTALLQTGHRELADKVRTLDQATAALAGLEQVTSQIEAWSAGAEESATKASEGSEAIAAALVEATKSASDLGDLRSSAAELLESGGKARDLLSESQEKLTEVIRSAEEQQALIAALMPKGASVGLAAAFAGRVRQLERSKWIWMTVFVGAMLGLFSLASRIIGLQASTSQALWQVILQRLPLAAPMIWLGWFSAVQYGNTLRVQEDYAFKEATSKAFAGYRDHMEHLASVSLAEGNTAMTLMAQKTIEILAQEPLRIFQDIGKDSAPTHGLLDALRGSGHNKEPK